MQDSASATDRVHEAHAEVLKDSSLQFDISSLPKLDSSLPKLDTEPPKTPEWIKGVLAAIESLGTVIGWIFWGAVILLVAFIVFCIAREILRLRKPGEKPKVVDLKADPHWRPDHKAASDLLAEADKLAARGEYAAATHLLLLRSVEDIQKHKPRALRVSLTSREIARLKSLPDAARPAFELIGNVVERSLFGGAPVDSDDFNRCRAAYEAFALPEGWRA